ncbi:MAG TPA: hypothetical protein VMD06_04615 [Steroidobacteraceae bacterium]|nr:hypothetical protein [Steroidobacteraceae bacterium]
MSTDADGLAIAVDGASCELEGEEAGASADANGPSDWLQEAAARPSTAQKSGRKIRIIGTLQILRVASRIPILTVQLTT